MNNKSNGPKRKIPPYWLQHRRVVKNWYIKGSRVRTPSRIGFTVLTRKFYHDTSPVLDVRLMAVEALHDKGRVHISAETRVV